MRVIWRRVLVAIGGALAAGVWLLGYMGGALSAHDEQARCRHCGGVVPLCQDPECETDPEEHEHEICGQVFDAGVRRGVFVAEADELDVDDVDQDDVDEVLEDDEQDDVDEVLEDDEQEGWP